jgi:hypothetical protein
MLEGENTGAPEQADGEIDVDGLLADVDAGREINPSQPPAEEPAAEQPERVWNGSEWEFEWNGKKIVPETADKLKVWAAQGYNYSQRMGELNKTHAQRMQEAEAREQAAKALEQKFSTYAQVDDYAQKNPEWWQHVSQSFQTRETASLDPQLAQVLNPLQEKLGALERIIQSQQEASERAVLEAKQREEDTALDAEIESIRKTYPNIDLSARDETGETLERRIYKHASDIGTTSFRAAFRDYLFDQLTVQQQAQQKLQATRQVQAQTKAGLLGRTPAPTRDLKPVDTRRPWSDPQYDVQSILDELHQAGG